jgi:hypothetical protein
VAGEGGRTVRKYLLWLSVAILVLIPLSGCTKPAVDEVSLDKEFTLSVGQSVSVKGEDLTITFVEVVSDSRCPTGATCIWAGEASSLIEITDSASTYRKVLTEPGSSSPTKADFTGYEVMFNLLPYPVLGKETKAKDYLLKLIVSKTP